MIGEEFRRMPYKKQLETAHAQTLANHIRVLNLDPERLFVTRMVLVTPSGSTMDIVGALTKKQLSEVVQKPEGGGQ